MSRCCSGTRSHVQSASAEGGEGGDVAVFAFAGSVSNPGKSKRNVLIKLCCGREKKFTLVCLKYLDTPRALSGIVFFSFDSQLSFLWRNFCSDQTQTDGSHSKPFSSLPKPIYILRSTFLPTLLNEKEPKTNLFPNRVLMKHGQIYWS